MNVCITLVYAFSKGAQSVFGGMKDKKQERKHGKKKKGDYGPARRAEGSRHPSAAVVNGHSESGGGPDREGSGPPGQEAQRRVLGISSEARAAAAGRRSMALMAGMRQRRRTSYFSTRRQEAEVLPPPQYDASAPRLPNYDMAVAMEGPERGVR